jgi:cytochrome c oxidase cbb3-type subunit 3
MKKMIIYGVLIFVITIGAILFYVNDIIGDDMINILTMFFAMVTLAGTISVALKLAHQMKNEKSTGEKLPYNWDGIGEYNNKLPMGWSIAFLLSMVFVMYYILVGYPTWSWSQIGQYNDEVNTYNEKYEKEWSKIAKNPNELIKMGESVFLVNCAICHGVLADGLDGKAQDLVQWSSEQHILDTIKNGSSGSHFSITMPAGLASGKDAKAIAAYVSSKLTTAHTTANPSLVKKGQKAFANTCASCHGGDGKGIPTLAPDLTNLVGSVLTTGRKGDIGSMPKFDMLNNIQKQSLNAYIYSLNK